jgi:hypothetical protein
MILNLVRNSLLRIAMASVLLGTTVTQSACVETLDTGSPNIETQDQAVVDFAIIGVAFLEDGTLLWTFARGAHIFGVAASSEAEALAILRGLNGATTILPRHGLFYLGPATGGGGAAGAGGGALVTGGVLVGAVLVAVVAVIAIDRVQNGNYIWEAVNDAGGWGIVLGTAPNPNATPNPGRVTVNCNPAAGDFATQCQHALRNVITGYRTWIGGSYWTCGEMWADSGSSNDWNNAMAGCNNAVAQCVAATQASCAAPPPPPPAAPAPPPPGEIVIAPNAPDAPPVLAP